MKIIKVNPRQEQIVKYNPRRQPQRHGLWYWLCKLWNMPIPAEKANSVLILVVFLVLVWLWLQK
jgi:hypothetical protein